MNKAVLNEQEVTKKNIIQLLAQLTHVYQKTRNERKEIMMKFPPEDEEFSLLEEIELLTVSPDVHGYTYRSYPIGDNLDREKEVWTIDLKSHIRTFYAPGRRVLSYAIVHRQNDSIDYLSNGYLHWLDE